MTECDEIAAGIAARLPAGSIPRSLDACRELVRAQLQAGESEVLIDNVAWSLMLCGRAVMLTNRTVREMIEMEKLMEDANATE